MQAAFTAALLDAGHAPPPGLHAADAVPLATDTLRRLPPERVTSLRLQLHPSLQILRARHPVATIWAMNTGRAPLSEIADWSAQDVLVLRPQLAVDVIPLAPGEAAFLETLQAGGTLGEAASVALDAAATFDLGPALAALFIRGAVIATETSEQDEE